MGATSSCINDIANDDFIPFLHVEEVHQDEESRTHFVTRDNLSMTQDDANTLSIPKIQSSTSDNSISNILDFLDTNDKVPMDSFLNVPQDPNNIFEMKPSRSDVSISFFLDREHISDTFDEQTFANVNADIREQSRKKSNTNVSFHLDNMD